MDREQSFGIIPMSYSKGYWEVFLIQHKHSKYWGFPKGHAEEGETPKEAATRELKEETHLDIVRYLQEEPIVEEYQFLMKHRPVSKRVVYFVAEVTGSVILQTHELQNGKWVALSAAKSEVTHPEGKAILIQVETILS